MTIKEKTKDMLQWYPEIQEDTIVDIMIKFAKEMCELQKKECAENADVNRYITTWLINEETGERYAGKQLFDKYEHRVYVKGNGESYVWLVDKNLIITCKNVCDEI